MKFYFFTLKQHHFRDGRVIGRICGIVTGNDEDEAEKKAVELAWTNNTSSLRLQEIDPEKGFVYRVYKASMSGIHGER